MNDEAFKSLDDQLGQIKADCAKAIKEMEDKLLAAQIEATMAKDQLAKALIAKEDAIQVASRLIERMSIAEEAFAAARKYALTLQPVQGTPLPPNEMGESIHPPGREGQGQAA